MALTNHRAADVVDDSVVAMTMPPLVWHKVGCSRPLGAPRFESYEQFGCCGVEAGFNLLQFGVGMRHSGSLCRRPEQSGNVDAIKLGERRLTFTPRTCSR